MNGIRVPVEINENDHYRGLHIACINPEDGHVEWALAFDTYKGMDHMDAFLGETIDKKSGLYIKNGWVIAAACKDECTKSLHTRAKIWFTCMGSAEIQSLTYR